MPNSMLKIKPTKSDDIDAAISMVLDLAIQGAVDKYDNPSEYRRQMTAIHLVGETFLRTGDWRR